MHLGKKNDMQNEKKNLVFGRRYSGESIFFLIWYINSQICPLIYTPQLEH